jgi:hypothetical protein
MPRDQMLNNQLHTKTKPRGKKIVKRSCTKRVSYSPLRKEEEENRSKANSQIHPKKYHQMFTRRMSLAK